METQLTAQEAVALLAEDEGIDNKDNGYTITEWAFSKALDSVCPGVCMDADCATITSRCEPDATNNWCHECEKNNVKSLGVLCWEL